MEFRDEDWTECYPDAKEYIDTERTPKSKVKSFPITVFKDVSNATLPDKRQSVTDIFILLGSAPILFYSKIENKAERSTYGSEVVATRIAIELILGLRYKLRMMGMEVKKSLLYLEIIMQLSSTPSILQVISIRNKNQSPS